MTATDLPFFRYSIPECLCSCGHGQTAHRIDTKAQACDLGGCPCRAFDLTHLRWRETRVVTEPVNP